MARAFDISATREYILKSERGESEDSATKFHLGVLDSRLAANLSDRAKAFGVNSRADDDASALVTLQFDTMHWHAVRFGLRGWENLLNKEGVAVKCERKMENIPGVGNRMGLTLDSMDLIKPYIEELAKEILRDANVSEEEKKNF